MKNREQSEKHSEIETEQPGGIAYYNCAVVDGREVEFDCLRNTS